jgi:SAM-dependent methyltransferase
VKRVAPGLWGSSASSSILHVPSSESSPTGLNPRAATPVAPWETTRTDPFDGILAPIAAQLGEIVWHSYTADAQLEAKSREHLTAITAAMRQIDPPADGRLRVLEVGAYAHFTGQMLASELAVDAVVCDISADSLKHGARAAIERGYRTPATLAAADFHDLPFETSYFDIVFIASAVHHTWRPEAVLRECFRVLRPGGVFVMYNEPCRRELCFYQFRSNREDSFTPFERHLASAGLLRTVSSPFYGSRPEQLFGMIENDRIPLSTLLRELEAGGTPLELTADAAACLGPFEEQVLAIGREHGDAGRIAAALLDLVRRHVGQAAAALGERDRLLGFSLPDDEALRALARRVAPDLAALAGCDSRERALVLARMFGASVRATVRRGGSGGRAERLFRRTPVENENVWWDPPQAPGVEFSPSELLLPDIQTTPAAMMHHFPSEQWLHSVEDAGVSLANVRSTPDVLTHAADVGRSVILLARFYAVCLNDEFYRIRVLADGVPIDTHVICQSESRLSRSLLHRCPDRISFVFEGLDGQPVDRPMHLRISVLQMLPVTIHRSGSESDAGGQPPC